MSETPLDRSAREEPAPKISVHKPLAVRDYAIAVDDDGARRGPGAVTVAVHHGGQSLALRLTDDERRALVRLLAGFAPKLEACPIPGRRVGVDHAWEDEYKARPGRVGPAASAEAAVKAGAFDQPPRSIFYGGPVGGGMIPPPPYRVTTAEGTVLVDAVEMPWNGGKAVRIDDGDRLVEIEVEE